VICRNPGGDRAFLVLTRDPVADRIGAVVVAALTRTPSDPYLAAQRFSSKDHQIVGDAPS
jgi:mRNA-degrading endonuclease toxin of MazEF toxin-antitoxin module